MRAILIAVLFCLCGQACDRQNSATLKPVPVPVLADDAMLSDEPGNDQPAGEALIRVSARTISASPDGSEADILINYSLDPSILTALQATSFVQFEYLAPNQPGRVVGRSSINSELGGSVDITVPTTEPNAQLVASLQALQPGVIENDGVLLAQLPAFAIRETTDLAKVQQLQASLVDGSYESSVVNGRRVHQFAIRVTDPTAGPIEELLAADADPAVLNYSISGLENNASTHFIALENEIEDIESPVSASFTEYPLAVYMVIDVSKSMVESKQADNLSHAAADTVIALAPNAQFDYRMFNGEVMRVAGLRDLDFDAGKTSASALYYALDTALSDIENFGSIDQDKVVMVFTDGKDLASRNYYNDDVIDNEQVHDYIVKRVEQVRKAQQETLGRQLDVYTIGYYDQDKTLDIPQEINKLDRIAKAGGTNNSYNNFNAHDIEDAFAAVVQNIRGVYYLQYSSQQTANNTKLELLVKVNGHQARIRLPNEFDATQ